MRLNQHLLAIAFLLAFSATTFATSYTWTGTTSTAWSVSTNWSPNGVPTATDNATIVSATNNPVYDGSAGLYNLTMTSGTLDLNGYALTLNNAGTFNSGTVTNGTIYANSISSFIFEGTLMDCKVKGITGGLRIYNTTFNDSLVVDKNGSANNSSNGLNKFMDYVSLTNSGTGYLRMGVLYPDTFHDKVSLTSVDNYISIAQNSGGTLFKDDVTVKCKTGTAIYLGINTASSITLEEGHVITVDTFSTGILRFEGFVQEGSTAQNITLTGDASLYLYRSEFNGALTTESARVFGRESIFNGVCDFTKNGTGDDSWNSGNKFYQSVAFTNDAGSDDDMRHGTLYPDTFYGKVTMNANSGSIILAYSDVGSATLCADTVEVYPGSGFITHLARWGDAHFEKDVVIGRSGSVYFGYSGGNPVFTNDARIKGSAAGYSSGTILLRNVVMDAGPVEELSLQGTAIINIDTATFNCPVHFAAPRIGSAYSAYNSASYFEKTGGTNDAWGGANVFNDSAEIVSSSTANLTLANGAGDDFNGDVTFDQQSTGRIYPGFNYTSTYAGNITANGTLSDLRFGNGSTISRNVLDGSGVQTISGEVGFISLKKLRINKPDGYVNVNTVVIVTDSLFFQDGVFEVAEDNAAVALDDNGVWTGASDTSHVVGITAKIGNDAFTFPVGRNGHYKPLTMSAPSSVTDTFYVDYRNINAGDYYSLSSKDGSLNEISSNEAWLFERHSGTSNVTVTLGWDDMSCGFDTLANVRIAAWDGSQWKDLGNGGTTGNTTEGTVTTSGASTIYGPFTLATIDTLDCVPCRADAGEDMETYRGQRVALGGASLPGATYSWTPTSRVNNASVSNPVGRSNYTEVYKLQTTNSDGCIAIDHVRIEAVVDPPMPHCHRAE